ncbi:MAG: histidine kinase [Lachnospiraceae bacterium]|nr:histidine kinase [Lachnospiraceae bacterium]
MNKTILPKSIRGKIMLCTAATTLAIAAITVAVCFQVFQSFLRRNQIQSAEYNLQVVSNNVSANLENIVGFTNWCCSNQEINHYLQAFRSQSRMPSISSKNSYLRVMALSTYDRLKEEYHNTHSFGYITRVLISPANRRNYLQITGSSGSNVPAAPDILYSSSFFGPLTTAPDYQWIGLIQDPLISYQEQLVIPISRPIFHQLNSQMLGWVYLSISDRILLDYLESFPLETDASLYLTIGEITYEYQNGTFLESQLPHWKQLRDISRQCFNQESHACHIQLEDGSRRTLLTCPLGNHGWTISHILSEQAYQAQSKLYLAIILGIVMSIILLGLVLYAMLNRLINRPVQKLLGHISQISQGDFTRDPSIEWGDELGTIGRGINQMSENVVTLMNKKVEDEKQKKDLEYQILQSQINPHFLYNTLNSIKWMATIQNATGIAEMTTALARLMKSVSKGTSARITLKEELDLVHDYFLIQQYRYGGSITIDYQISRNELYQCLIHRFTLQPIIENALFHGIEPKGCAGRILVKAEDPIWPDGRHLLVISVTDNGVGMSEETIQQVLKGDAPPTADFFRQVGINNVNKRIQYNFGEAYGITIESRLGEYTTMKISLPFETAQGE